MCLNCIIINNNNIIIINNSGATVVEQFSRRPVGGAIAPYNEETVNQHRLPCLQKQKNKGYRKLLQF